MQYRKHILKALMSAGLALVLATTLHAFAATGSSAQAKSSHAAMSSMSAPVDINTATVDQLKAVPGIGDVYASKIIASRPYASKSQLVSKGVMSQGVYNKVKSHLVATHAKK